MHYRVFPKPQPKTVESEGRPTFGRRTGFAESLIERLTTGRVVKALLLGIGIGALGVLFAPAM